MTNHAKTQFDVEVRNHIADNRTYDDLDETEKQRICALWALASRPTASQYEIFEDMDCGQVLAYAASDNLTDIQRYAAIGLKVAKTIQNKAESFITTATGPQWSIYEAWESVNADLRADAEDYMYEQMRDRELMREAS